MHRPPPPPPPRRRLLLLLLLVHAAHSAAGAPDDVPWHRWDDSVDPALCPAPARSDVALETLARTRHPRRRRTRWEAHFEARYRERRPARVRGLTERWAARTAWTRGYLIDTYGALVVGSGTNTAIVDHAGQVDPDDDEHSMTLEDFIHAMRQPVPNARYDVDLATMRLREKAPTGGSGGGGGGGGLEYAFDAEFFEQSDLSSDMLRDCQPLPHPIARAVGGFGNQTGRATRYFGLGRRGAGVGWHQHTEGWLFQLTGTKRVFLYPPDTLPPIEQPSWRSQVAWVTQVLPRLSRPPIESPPLEVTLGPGDTLYLPSGWWHSTINCGESLSLAVQFRPQNPPWSVDHLLYEANVAMGVQHYLEARGAHRTQARQYERMVGRLLRRAVRQGPLRAHTRLWYAEYLEQRPPSGANRSEREMRGGQAANNLKALEQARMAGSLAPHNPRCQLECAWALTMVSADLARTFAARTRGANAATTAAGRQLLMKGRDVLAEELAELYQEWAGALGLAVVLDKESPRVKQDTAGLYSQQKAVTPKALRMSLDAAIDGAEGLKEFLLAVLVE